jgi:hypothetical protein
MAASSDIFIKDKEVYIVNLLANNIGVADGDIEEYCDMRLRFLLKICRDQKPFNYYEWIIHLDLCQLSVHEK